MNPAFISGVFRALNILWFALLCVQFGCAVQKRSTPKLSRDQASAAPEPISNEVLQSRLDFLSRHGVKFLDPPRIDQDLLASLRAKAKGSTPRERAERVDILDRVVDQLQLIQLSRFCQASV